MNPTFSNCTLLINERANISDLVVGEIVVINTTNIMNGDFNYSQIAHRVIYIDEINEKIATRGDNDLRYSTEEEIDGEFDYEKIIGKNTYHLNMPNYFCNRKV